MTGTQDFKKQCEFKHLKEATVNWIRYLIFKACFMTSQMPQLFLKRLHCLSCIVSTLRNHCIVSTLRNHCIVSTLRNDCIVSTLRNSSHLSASSRRSEDVKMLRVTLFTERGRCSEDSWDYKLFILFLFCLENSILFWRPASLILTPLYWLLSNQINRHVVILSGGKVYNISKRIRKNI